MFGNILAQATVAALRIGFVRGMASADGDGQASKERAARNAAKTGSLVGNFMNQLDEMRAEQEQAAASAFTATAEPESPMIGATIEPDDRGSFRMAFESAMAQADEAVAQEPVTIPVSGIDPNAAAAAERLAEEVAARQARIKAKRQSLRSEITMPLQCKTEPLSEDAVVTAAPVRPSKAPRLLAKSEVVTAAQKQEVKSEAAADRLTPGEHGAMAAADHWYNVMNAETDVFTAALKQEVKAEAAADPRLRAAEVPHHDRLEPEGSSSVRPARPTGWREVQHRGTGGTGWHTVKHFLSRNVRPFPLQWFYKAFPAPPKDHTDLNDQEYKTFVIESFRHKTKGPPQNVEKPKLHPSSSSRS